MDEQKYRERRAQIESYFRTGKRLPETTKTFVSPSGSFRLETVEYHTRPDAWNYSRGVVTRVRDDRVIADVGRNYSHFWHAWVVHPNGHEYLLCGEDYQGQTVVNLTAERSVSFFPEAGYGSGWGFCWAAAYPSPDGRYLAVDGCYWGAPYEIVIYRFGHPDELPYSEVSRHPGILEWKGWVSDSEFEYEGEFDVRASDGKPYEELSEEEKDAADDSPGGVSTRTELHRVQVGLNP